MRARALLGSLWLAGAALSACSAPVPYTVEADDPPPYLRKEVAGREFYETLAFNQAAQAFTFFGVVLEPQPTKDFPLIWGATAAPPVAIAAAPTEVARLLPAPEGRRRVLAVMELEVRTPRLGAEVAGRAVDYLRARLTATRQFAIVDRTRQEQALREMLVQQKKESYAACYDEGCQVPLGKALAADTILRSSVSSLADFCTLSSELVDLAKEAALGGGLEKFDCTEAGLVQAIERLVPQLLGT